MSIEGRIAIDVNFADSSNASGVQSLKKISLVDTSSYTTGKIAFATGTVGASQQALSISSYLDADGNAVTFTSVNRAAFRCVGAEGLFIISASPELTAGRSSGNVCVNDIPAAYRAGGVSGYRVRTVAGTGTYTLVLYGT